jgi:NADPH:quinone reductase-like Zn-dependent oxidoreductase
MRAFTLDSAEDQPAIRDDVPTPTPGPEQLLVRVHASSVNPVDAAVVAGMLRGMIDHEFPVTLGRDFAGVVEDVGSAVGSFRPGDEVYGSVPLADPAVHAGSWADYLVAADTTVARAPDGVDVATAGAAPLAALTALAAYDALEPFEGATVLVVGATGGVGSFFVQLAASAGATVVATGFPDDGEYLRGLGAAEVIDRDADVAAQVRERHPEGVDALLDVVSREPDASVLRAGGRLASPLGAAGDGPGRTNVVAVASTPNLERLAGLLGGGELRVPVQRTYALEEAGAALDDLASAHTLGKVAIAVA